VFVGLYRPSQQVSHTPEQSSPLYKKYQINLLKCIQNAFLHPNHGFCQKKKSVHLAIPLRCRLIALRRGVHHCTRAGAEFTTHCTRAGAEFTTAQEVPDRSAQMHSKRISTYLTMVFVKKEYVFVRLYRPSRQASRTPERSSPLYKKYQIDPLKYIENTFLHPQPWFLSKRNMCSSGYIALHGRLPALRSGVHHCTRSTT